MPKRSQAAMEFLMTYGWSILIIAVVLGALFQLGVFSSTNFAPKAQAGNCRIFRVAGMANLEGVCQGEQPRSVTQFDGASSRVETSNIAGLNNLNAISVTGWILLSVSYSQMSSTYPGPFAKSGNSWGFYGSKSTNTQNLYITDQATSTQYTIASNLALSPGIWYFIAGTYDGSAEKLYLNGQIQTATSSWSGAIRSTTGNLDFGEGDGSQWFRGDVANIQIYNVSLDANQIAALYQKGIGAAPIDPNHVVGWWPLNGDVNDYSGNNNAGTPTSVTYSSQWTGGYTAP